MSTEKPANMELRTFISNALQEIVAGVSDAQDTLSHESRGVINPHLKSGAEAVRSAGFLPSDVGPASIVQFDIALTIATEKGTKGGIGVATGIVALGSQGQSSSENSSVSRVSFSVPVALPSTN